MNRLAALASALLLAVSACRSTESFDPVDLTYSTTDRTDMSVSATQSPTLPPRLDRSRKVAEQDCSKPLALDRGNIKCR
jgi:hypothetical protein